MQMKWLVPNEGVRKGGFLVIGCDCARVATHWALVGDAHWEPPTFGWGGDERGEDGKKSGKRVELVWERGGA
jgi:hypothetical protein